MAIFNQIAESDFGMNQRQGRESQRADLERLKFGLGFEVKNPRVFEQVGTPFRVGWAVHRYIAQYTPAQMKQPLHMVRMKVG